MFSVASITSKWGIKEIKERTKFVIKLKEGKKKPKVKNQFMQVELLQIRACEKHPKETKKIHQALE